MSSTYRAWRMFDDGGVVSGRLVERPVAELEAAGGVLIQGAHAGVNYKDALTGFNRGTFCSADRSRCMRTGFIR